jgi:hypothetical protein
MSVPRERRIDSAGIFKKGCGSITKGGESLPATPIIPPSPPVYLPFFYKLEIFSVITSHELAGTEGLKMRTDHNFTLIGAGTFNTHIQNNFYAQSFGVRPVGYISRSNSGSFGSWGEGSTDYFRARFLIQFESQTGVYDGTDPVKVKNYFKAIRRIGLTQWGLSSMWDYNLNLVYSTIFFEQSSALNMDCLITKLDTGFNYTLDDKGVSYNEKNPNFYAPSDITWVNNCPAP